LMNTKPPGLLSIRKSKKNRNDQRERTRNPETPCCFQRRWPKGTQKFKKKIVTGPFTLIGEVGLKVRRNEKALQSKKQFRRGEISNGVPVIWTTEKGSYERGAPVNQKPRIARGVGKGHRKKGGTRRAGPTV